MEVCLDIQPGQLDLAFDTDLDLLIKGWDERCSSYLAQEVSSTVTTPLPTITPAGDRCGLCEDMYVCQRAESYALSCYSVGLPNGSDGAQATTDGPAMRSCACQPHVLDALSYCAFVEEPPCFGTMPEPSSVFEPFMWDCPSATAILTNFPTVV